MILGLCSTLAEREDNVVVPDLRGNFCRLPFLYTAQSPDDLICQVPTCWAGDHVVLLSHLLQRGDIGVL